MTILELLSKINSGKNWDFNDYLSIQDDICRYAAAGNIYAAKLEDHYEVVINASGFEAVKPMLTKLIRKLGNENVINSAEAVIKAASTMLVTFAGYKQLSGVIPRSLYSNIMLVLHGLNSVEDPRAKELHAIITFHLKDENYIVAQYDMNTGKDDFMDFLRPQVVKVSSEDAGEQDTTKNKRKRASNTKGGN